MKNGLRDELGLFVVIMTGANLNRFTVADLNVAGVVTGLGLAKYDLSPWPKVGAAWKSKEVQDFVRRGANDSPAARQANGMAGSR